MEYSVGAYMVLLLMWLGFHLCSLSLRASASAVTCQVQSAGTCSRISEECSSDRRIHCPNYPREELGSERECNHKPCDGGCSGSQTTISLSNVSVQLIPYDREDFSINVSWVVNTPGVCGGFKVKVTQDMRPFRCKCVSDLSASSYSMLDVKYTHVERQMEVSVTPYPAADAIPSFSGRFKRPQSCDDLEIPTPEELCDLSHYGSSEDFSVESTVCNSTKTMEISWASPVSSDALPTYYVYLYQHGDTTPEHVFEVNNATSITVHNLNQNIFYSVQLQLHGLCSEAAGLPANYRGCGVRSPSMLEHPTECLPTTKVQPSSTQPSPTPNATIEASSLVTNSSSSVANSSSLDMLLILVVIPAVAIIVGILVIFLLARRWYHDHRSHPAVGFKIHQVFVFYSPTTPQKEITYIQEHIVCPLLEYFEVVTLNNFTSGDLPTWIERMMQMSKSVLLVSNKEFCLQWSKNDEEESHEPTMNCLRYIISAAVSSHSLEKFGILTIKESSKNCIPVNSYLENFPVFTISKSKGKSKRELEDIYHFVTHTPTFQFSTGSTPTTEGPAHVAVYSTE